MTGVAGPGAGGVALRLGLDAAALAMLDRLSLPSRRPVLGAPGQRRSQRTGGSTEFADFRPYAPGDDFRRVDWNAYARQDRLVLRLHSAEEDVTLTLWVDTSTSMGFGGPPKLRCAARLAAGLAYVALAGDDRVALSTISDAAVRRVPPVQGRRAAPRVWDALDGLCSGGGTDLASVGRARRAPGIGVLISDFLAAAGVEAALAALRAAHQEPVLLRILAPEEVAPQLSGDLRLIDAETGGAVEVTVTPALLRDHRARLRQRTDALRALATRHHAPFVDLISNVSLADALASCRAVGLLR